MAVTKFYQAFARLPVLLFVLSSSLLPQGEGAKILMLPFTGGIHSQAFGQLGAALIAKGHQVNALVNGDCEATKQLKKSGLKLIPYNNSLGGCIMETPQVQFTINTALESSDLSTFNILSAFSSIGPLLKSEMRSLLSDHKLFTMLNRKSYDLIIVDGMIFYRYVYVLAYRLQKPIVSIQTILNAFEAGIPALPSVYPSQTGPVTQELGFVERTRTVLSTGFYFHLLPWLAYGSMNKLVTEYAPDLPYLSISDIARESQLWLVLRDDVIDYPTISAPNVIPVGGINTKPAQPLTGHLRTLADEAKDGLILINFQSEITLPPKVNKMILLAAGQVQQTVIVKYSGQPIKGLSKNIHLVPEIPQNDLLGHPNTRLLITDCEVESLYESLYHSVPVIAMPVFGNQLRNAQRITHHGMGLTMNFKTLTVDDLTANIKEVISNSAFSENCWRRSTVYKDRPMTAIDRAVYWIEHVAQHGSGHLRPLSGQLGFVQYWCLDVALLGLAMSMLLFYIIINFLKCLFFSCCSRRKPVPTAPSRPKTD